MWASIVIEDVTFLYPHDLTHKFNVAAKYKSKHEHEEAVHASNTPKEVFEKYHNAILHPHVIIVSEY